MNLDRTLANIARLVRQFVGNEIVGPRVDYLAAYPCVAVTQNSDGTLELQPDDKRLPPVTAPIRIGVPGVTVTVANNARVLLQWTGGDPTKPVATLWESASVTAITVTATTVNVNGGTVNIGTGADAKIARYEELKTAYDTHLHNVPIVGPAGTTPTTAPTVALPTSVGASKGKVS